MRRVALVPHICLCGCGRQVTKTPTESGPDFNRKKYFSFECAVRDRTRIAKKKVDAVKASINLQNALLNWPTEGTN